MFSLSLKRTLLPALLGLLLPGALLAQQPAASGSGAPQQEVQTWLVEMQQLHGQLEALQQRALEDAKLNAAQEQLGASIKAAMEKADPSLQQSLTRFQALEGEAAAAQQAGNQAKLQQLATEAQKIEQKFMAAQQQVLQQPEISAKVEAFQTQLETKMREIDPKAEQLIARFQTLEKKLAQAMQAAQGQGH